MRITMQKEIKGSILDVGGGGEGVISRLYPEQAVVIDNRLEELEEAPKGVIKLVMDARSMTFTEECFDNVTLFYSFMYMQKSDYHKVVAEIVRVLKLNGHLHLWDADITEANPFLTHLEIEYPDHSLNTTYGIYKEDANQNSEYFKGILKNYNLKMITEKNEDGHFYQKWEKYV
jgi:ubiquinone/menaquinone biosynthesis C-methylase UbiE